MHKITEPLQLAVGSHTKGSGYGCAMNVISWENGDKVITDFPNCSDRYLAAMVQMINDSICQHTTKPQGYPDYLVVLCPACSMKVLDLAHRTVGTNIGSRYDTTEVWLQIFHAKVNDMVLSIQEHGGAKGFTMKRRLDALIKARALGELFLATMHRGYGKLWRKRPDGPGSFRRDQAQEMILGAYNAGVERLNCNHDLVLDAVFAALHTIVHPHGAGGTDFLLMNHYGKKPVRPAEVLAAGHRAIDLFELISGIKSTPPAPEVTEAAVEKMLVVGRG